MSPTSYQTALSRDMDFFFNLWSGKPGSNWRHSAWKADALPTELFPHTYMVIQLFWWREQDLNLRPSGYEPDELPGCSIPRHGFLLSLWSGKPGSNWRHSAWKADALPTELFPHFQRQDQYTSTSKQCQLFLSFIFKKIKWRLKPPLCFLINLHSLLAFL